MRDVQVNILQVHPVSFFSILFQKVLVNPNIFLFSLEKLLKSTTQLLIRGKRYSESFTLYY